MSVVPVRESPTDVNVFLEIEASSLDGDVLTVAERQLIVDSAQRVVVVMADDNAGRIGHWMAQLRLTDAPSVVWDDERAVVVLPPPPPDDPPPPPPDEEPDLAALIARLEAAVLKLEAMTNAD